MTSPTAPTLAISRETLFLLGFAYGIGLLMLMTAAIYDGPLAEPALAIAVGCLIVLVVQFERLLRGRSMAAIPFSARRWLMGMVGILAIFPIATWADRRLLLDATDPPTLIHVIQALNLVLLASYVPGLLRGEGESSRWRIARFGLFAAGLVVAGASVIALSAHPHIDVWQLQEDAARAVLHGQSPYTVVRVRETAGPRAVIGYSYPPTTCYFNAIALVLGGDVRWASLTAILSVGIASRVLRRMSPLPEGAVRPAFLEDAPALLLWLSPKTLFYLEQSWNDVNLAALVALALVAHAFRRRLVCALLLGIALSAKQTMIWLVPLALVLEFRPAQWALLIGTAAALVAPFVLADFAQMKHWMVDMYVHYAPRDDALSLSNFLDRHFGMTPHKSTGLFLAATSTALAVWRAPRTRYAFALTMTLALFAFFIFNIWMFMNAYFMCTAFAVVAASADAPSSGSKMRTSSPVLA